jgi:large subunit ribosomal protein L19e
MKLQKRLAARVMKCSPYRIKFDTDNLSAVKEAITAFDVRRLINQGIIMRTPEQDIARFRARHIQAQKRKSRRARAGSRKGSANARAQDKLQWMRRIRAQRDLLKRLRDHELITQQTFNTTYQKAKGGFFRSTHHIKLFLQEQKLFVKK